MSALPTIGQLQGAIDNQKIAQLEIDQALKKSDIVVALVRALVLASGTALSTAGVPFAGTGAQLAKMAIDSIADRS